MASSRSLLSEDELQCSICLDVFTDPVTTPCGHNFCMICLKEFWDRSSHCQCPVCKEEFSKRPELRVNMFISSLAAQFKEKLPSKPKKVLCDSCTEEKLEALKSCLHCGVSYCNTHLMLHKTTAKLMKHKLIDPVENLEDYICQKHERPLELFCRDDQVCVCQFCTEGEHKAHNTVPLAEESEDNKTELWMIHKVIQQMIQERLKKIEEIRNAIELNNDTKEKEKADIVEIFRALMLYIERSQAELEKKKKAEEKQAKWFIKELEQEITELKRRTTELEQLSHTEDHLHLLQIYPSLCSPPHTQDWSDLTINTHLSVETLRRKIIQEVLNNGMEKFAQNELKRIQQHAVAVTLDPDTANPSLTLSNDGTEVTCENVIKNLPDNPERFDRCVCVLGKDGFSTGRFYYEVQVKGKTKWDLGVVRQFVNRKGIITACPENGFWCVSDNQAEFVALDTPPIPLSLKQAPQKVGVFVDYEEGLISFYDVDAKSHIYSFTGQTFTEKLYPFFSPCLENSAPLIICQLTRVLQSSPQKLELQQFKEKLPSKPKKVLCDSCTEEKLEALKSCLHCGVSYCNTHLMLHKTTAKLMKHKLIDPVENLEDYICQKHERPLESFCRDDQTCVCQFCTEGEHETHNTVPLEEEIREKTWLKEKQAEVQQLIQEKLKQVKEIKHSVKLSKIYPSLCSPPHTQHWTRITNNTHLSVETLYRARVSASRNSQRGNQEASQNHSNNCNQAFSITCKLKKIQQYSVDVTLDPDTAHPNLILSDDGKEVRHNRYMVENLPDYPERFDTSLYVLGNEGFISGRIYYEVNVHGKTDWILGVVRESIKRKGPIIPCPEDGYYCVWKRNDDEYSAWNSILFSLSMKQAPQKVGVFVDYEEGLISFYDVDAKSHIYSFTGQTFTEKLYPIFSPCNHKNGQNVVPLVICSRS
ncbi:hypothetical protein QTP86_030305 [Hemibagrus guttatus]|nr:hypothetical protein QTP86_030305 [Hemibagrus guttatus]